MLMGVEPVLHSIVGMTFRACLPRLSCIREERKAGAPLFAPRPSSCSSLRLLHHYSMKWKVSITFFPRSSKRCSPPTPAYLPVPPLMALTPGARPERLG